MFSPLSTPVYLPESEHFRFLSYPRTDVFLLCFNVASPTSFQNVREKWFPEVIQHCPGAACVVVGTKIDLRDDQEVVERLAHSGLRPITTAQGAVLARELQAVKYIECSALTMQGVENMLYEVGSGFSFPYVCEPVQRPDTPRNCQTA